MTDFNNITPCGGNCIGCVHYLSCECKGCRSNGGKCVSMWENGCAIYECCNKHGVLFCGLCTEFPCEWIVSKLGEWDNDGISRQQSLANEYNERYHNG